MKLEITKASEVQVKSVEWLWYPYIPYGKVTVLQGDAGDGKSTLILKLAAMLTRGEPMPLPMARAQNRSMSFTSPQRTMQTIRSFPALLPQAAIRTDCCLSMRRNSI